MREACTIANVTEADYILGLTATRPLHQIGKCERAHSDRKSAFRVSRINSRAYHWRCFRIECDHVRWVSPYTRDRFDARLCLGRVDPVMEIQGHDGAGIRPRVPGMNAITGGLASFTFPLPVHRELASLPGGSRVVDIVAVAKLETRDAVMQSASGRRHAWGADRDPVTFGGETQRETFVPAVPATQDAALRLGESDRQRAKESANLHSALPFAVERQCEERNLRNLVPSARGLHALLQQETAVFESVHGRGERQARIV